MRCDLSRVRRIYAVLAIVLVPVALGPYSAGATDAKFDENDPLAQNDPEPPGLDGLLGDFTTYLEVLPCQTLPGQTPKSGPYVGVEARHEIGDEFPIRLCNFAPNAPIDVVVTQPDGRSRPSLRVDTEGAGHAVFTWDAVPGDPIGSYKIKATQGTQQLNDTFSIGEASRGKVLVLPKRGRGGSTFRIALAGFAPGQYVALHIYRCCTGVKSDYVTSLATVQMDDHGRAIRDLPSHANDPRATYKIQAVAPAAADSSDSRFFPKTGYRIDRDAFWRYYQSRGGLKTFGYPVSREFQFLGCTTQFFQRLIMQQCGTSDVGTMNLLDDDLLPYTQIHGSTFPAINFEMKASTPRTTDEQYGRKILDFVRANAPDTFDGKPVHFSQTFFGSIAPELAGTSDSNILGLLSLELWGAPTSHPAYDPANRSFIYQRFQRGIMHYDQGCGCTQGLLLADYLKAVITGQGVPPDLQLEVRHNSLYRSFSSDRVPPGTNYDSAFADSVAVADFSLDP